MTFFPLKPRDAIVRMVTTRLSNDWYSGTPAPDAAAVCTTLNETFWASMLSEEGRPVRAAVALQSNLCSPLRLSEPVDLYSHTIAKLSASFPSRRGAIGVSFRSGGRPLISRLILEEPRSAWVLDILGAGHIVIRNGVSIHAVLLPDGSQPLIFAEGIRVEDEWHDLFVSQIGHTPVGRLVLDRPKTSDLLRTLCRAMIEHRRGGSVVLLWPELQDWKESVEFTYGLDSGERYLAQRLSALRKWQKGWSRRQQQKRKAKGEERPGIEFYPDSEPERELKRAFQFIGGLTAVDGALVMTTAFDILGYGAKLKTGPRELRVREWRPDAGYADSVRHGSSGGTRHRSAAQFALDYPRVVVLVASQDGRFTVFCSDQGEQEVLAFRVEWLLL